MVFLYRFVTLFNLKLKQDIYIEKRETNCCTDDGFAFTGIKILGVQDYRRCHLGYSCSNSNDQIREKCTYDIN